MVVISEAHNLRSFKINKLKNVLNETVITLNVKTPKPIALNITGLHQSVAAASDRGGPHQLQATYIIVIIQHHIT